MKKFKLTALFFLAWAPAIWASEFPTDFAQLKINALQTAPKDFKACLKLLDGYLAEHKNDLTQTSLQAFYHFYAKMLFLHRDYSQAVQMLRMAIDRYESDSEPSLLLSLDEYQKYLNKPMLKIPVPTDSLSCETLKGIWYGSICNLPTIDRGKICSDSSECQGGCEAPNGAPFGQQEAGRCSERLYSETGCFNAVIDGITSGEICRKQDYASNK